MVGFGKDRHLLASFVAKSKSEESRSQVSQVELSISASLLVDSGSGDLGINSGSIGQVDGFETAENEVFIGKAAVNLLLNLGPILDRVLLERQLALESESAPSSFGQMEQDTEGGSAVSIEVSARSWELKAEVRIQSVLSSLNSSEVKNTGKLSWLNLKLSSFSINRSLDFDLFGNVNVLLVRRVDDLIYTKLTILALANPFPDLSFGPSSMFLLAPNSSLNQANYQEDYS